MTDIRLVRDYPHPPTKVWRALTDPKLLALWSMRPEGHSLEVGARFKFYGEANSHWRGYVECQMLEVQAPSRLRYSWIGDDSGRELIVSYTLEPRASGTRLTLVHSGYAGVGGFLLAKLIMTPGWKKMLDGDFRAVLDQSDENGALLPGRKLLPKY
ncbi:MAG: SRPBCC domain-containing protein [Polyangiaceae bacterium]